MAGQVQLDRAARLAAVGIVEQTLEIGVGEHAAAVVAQADAGIVEPRRRHHRLHVDERVAVLARRMLLHSTAHRRHVVPGVRIRRLAARHRRGRHADPRAEPHARHALMSGVGISGVSWALAACGSRAVAELAMRAHVVPPSPP